MREKSSEIRSAESAGRHFIKKLRHGGKRHRRLAALLAVCSPENPCGQDECAACLQLKTNGEVVPLGGTVPPRSAITETRAIPICAIHPVFNQRPLVEANLELIVNSISVNGMRHPISVIELGSDRYGLLDGAYRLAAQQRLGAGEILCSIETNEDAAKRWNLAANLSRVNLTALEQAVSISAYLDLVRHALQAGQVAQPGGHQPNDKGFSRAAGELGWSREKIRRATAIAKLSADAQAVARDLGLDDNEHQLLAAAKQPDPSTQTSFLRDLKERRGAKVAAAKFDRLASGTDDANAKVAKDEAPSVVPSETIDPLAPDKIDANADGLDIPTDFIRLSNEEQEIADRLISMWAAAPPRVRRWVRARLDATTA